MTFIPMCSYLIMFLLPVRKCILFEYTQLTKFPDLFEWPVSLAITLFVFMSSVGFYWQWLCIFLKIMVGNVNQFSFNN